MKPLARSLAALAALVLVSAFIELLPAASAPAQAVAVKNLNSDEWAWADKGAWRQVGSVEVDVRVGELVNVSPNIISTNNLLYFYAQNVRNHTTPSGRIPTTPAAYGELPEGMSIDDKLRLEGAPSSRVKPGTYYAKYVIVANPDSQLGEITMWGVYKINVLAEDRNNPAPTREIEVEYADEWSWADKGPWRQVRSVSVDVRVGDRVDVPHNIISLANVRHLYSQNLRNAVTPNDELPTTRRAFGQLPEGMSINDEMRLEGAPSYRVEPGTYYAKYVMVVRPNIFWGDITMWGIYRINVHPEDHKLPRNRAVISTINRSEWAWADQGSKRQVYSWNIDLGRANYIDIHPNISSKENLTGYYQNNEADATEPSYVIPSKIGDQGQIPKGLRLTSDMRLVGKLSDDVKSGVYYVKYGITVRSETGDTTMWGLYKLIFTGR